MTTSLRTGETSITHKMRVAELGDAVGAAGKINGFVRINAAAGLSPCVIALLVCDADEDLDVDVEVRALLFVECWKNGFDPVHPSYLSQLYTELSNGKTGWSTTNYPQTYCISE